MNRIAPYWKAVVAFIAPGAVLLGGAVLEGSDGGSVITGSEIVTALVACVVTAAGVYRADNAPSYAGQDAADHGQEEPLAPKPLPVVDTDGYIGQHEAGR